MSDFPMRQPGDDDTRTVVKFMRALGRLMPADDSGENASAVRMFARMESMKDLASGMGIRRLLGRARGVPAWPAVSGVYELGDARGCVAVCALTSEDLLPQLARLEHVAIAGRLIVANLGIEKIVLNTISNPRIRFLLLCGKESLVFHPAQALEQLFDAGVDAERRIIGAQGHLPVLGNLSEPQIAQFRQQVELVRQVGETDVEAIATHVQALYERVPGAFTGPRASEVTIDSVEGFQRLAPVGKRGQLEYDTRGFFVVSLDRKKGEIVLRHYHADNRPGHEVRARSAESAIRPALAQGIVGQLDHAAYLGAELAKAEAALRLDLKYVQDRPLARGT